MFSLPPPHLFSHFHSVDLSAAISSRDHLTGPSLTGTRDSTFIHTAAPWLPNSPFTLLPLFFPGSHYWTNLQRLICHQKLLLLCYPFVHTHCLFLYFFTCLLMSASERVYINSFLLSFASPPPICFRRLGPKKSGRVRVVLSLLLLPFVCVCICVYTGKLGTGRVSVFVLLVFFPFWLPERQRAKTDQLAPCV